MSFEGSNDRRQQRRPAGLASELPAQMRRKVSSDEQSVVVRWQRIGKALAQARRRELRELREGDALQAAAELSDLIRLLPPKQDQHSGLVEQQRLFDRARR
jgi:predicted DNA-binding WGR domain protein